MSDFKINTKCLAVNPAPANRNSILRLEKGIPVRRSGIDRGYPVLPAGKHRPDLYLCLQCGDYCGSGSFLHSPSGSFPAEGGRLSPATVLSIVSLTSCSFVYSIAFSFLSLIELF